MSDDLSILPPDNDVFHKNKNATSDKQKAHLIKAREKARQTIERRKMLDKQLKEKEEKEKEDLETVQEEDTELETEDDEQPKKAKPRRQVKKVELTEEEQDARRFQKFMKNMKMYEKEKERLRLEEEEAKKIKLSFTQDEYDDLVKLLEREDELLNKKKEVELSNPSIPKKEPEPEPITSVHRSLRPRPVNRGRFGR